jgi:OFA family oxalate/formate antiporter-like MFS transporter
MALSSLGLAVGLLFFANADLIGQASTGPVFTILAISACFFVVRFFGQGCMTLVSRITLSKWFNHHRGLATGLSTVISAYAFNASPTFLNTAVEQHGWKMVFYGLALFSGTAVVLMALIFYRDNPEQCGLAMDGQPTETLRKKNPKSISRFEVRRQFTRAQAIRTMPFWAMSSVTSWQALFMTAFAFHLTSIGDAFGLTRHQAYAVFPLIGVVSALSAVLGGWISDRIELKWLFLASTLGQLIASVSLLAFGNETARYFFALGYGIFAGLFGVLLTVSGPRFFGREHLGAIAGFNQSLLVISSALGPYLFSLLYDVKQTYTPVTWVCLSMAILLIVPTLLMRNPQPTQ